MPFITDVGEWLGSLPDWLSGLTDVSAIPLQALGFGLAFWQIAKARSESTKAKNAAEAAGEAIANTRRSMIISQLESLVPQLHHREEELERAVQDQEGDAIREALRLWRTDALRLAAALSELAPLGAEVVSPLKKSALAAGQVGRKLLVGPSLPDMSTEQSLEIFEPLLGVISEVTAELPELEQQISARRFGGGEGWPAVSSLGDPRVGDKPEIGGS